MEIDKEEILNKMREIKFNRENDFIENNQEDSKVTDVKYLGVIEINGESKQIYLLEEEKDGNKIERYYTQDGEFLGGNNKTDMYDFIILAKEYADDKEILESLQNLEKEDIISLNEIEDERLEQIATALGIEKEELKRICEIDSEKEIDIDNKDEKEQEGFMETEEGKEILSKKQIEKISAKSEINSNQKVTDVETMSSILKVEDKGYKKIAIIDTDNMKKTGNTTRFSIVGIKDDGSAEKIDTLEQGYGKNPTKEISSINEDGTQIENEQVNSIYKIKGEQENQIAIKIGAAGTIETSFVRTPKQDNQKAISIPIENTSIKPTTTEVKKFMNKEKNPQIKENIEELEEHEELECKDIQLKDIDDDKYNNTHEHINIPALARSILDDNDRIASVYNQVDVEIRIFNEMKKNKGIKIEQLRKNVEREMEKTAEMEYNSPEHKR